VAVIPIRLPPLHGEALDSWLETYACRLHVTVPDIFALAGVDWEPFASDGASQHKLWLYQLDEPSLAALSAVSGVPAATLADMTLTRYEGTGLAAVTGPARPAAVIFLRGGRVTWTVSPPHAWHKSACRCCFLN